jgi:hypothetical protein
MSASSMRLSRHGSRSRRSGLRGTRRSGGDGRRRGARSAWSWACVRQARSNPGRPKKPRLRSGIPDRRAGQPCQGCRECSCGADPGGTWWGRSGPSAHSVCGISPTAGSRFALAAVVPPVHLRARTSRQNPMTPGSSDDFLKAVRMCNGAGSSAGTSGRARGWRDSRRANRRIDSGSVE